MLLSRFGHLPSLTLGISFGINNIDRHERSIRPLSEQPALRQPEGRRITSPYCRRFPQKTRRKILRGFTAFAADHPEAVLLVKLVIDNERPTLATVQQNTLIPKFQETTTLHSNNVIFISPALDEDGMTSLFRLADHYVCLSIGEGQNLPLCEAMAQGVVPVSVSHTAMADYVDESIGIVVPSARTMVFSPGKCTTWMAMWTPSTVTEADYLDALGGAALKDGFKARLAAHERARDLFSSDAVTRTPQPFGFDFRGIYETDALP
jgi:glycosyltransferase involved in cell wall biosynthesis